ncbi:MAG TPA: nucleoside transporter C-terminal domain-containing protein [Nocardioidaceae bacterium]
MSELRGLVGLAVLIGIAVVFSKNRSGIRWRTAAAALTVQVVFALLVLRWGPGREALDWVSDRVTQLIGYTNEGTSFVFGPLTGVGSEDETIFALQVLPVIIFLGALIGLLFYLRVIQYVTHVIGGGIAVLLRVSKIEAMYASTVIFLGQSEAPLMIAPYLRGLTTAQLFTVMTSGFAAAAGSTLVGYSLLGAPLPYLLAATVMNAPAGLLMAKLVWPDGTEDTARRRTTPRGESAEEKAAAAVGATRVHEDDAVRRGRDRDADVPETSGAASSDRLGDDERHDRDSDDADEHADAASEDFDVRSVRDEESANAIDALGRGALAGGKIAVTVGALLIAFIALIAMANSILSGIGGWFGYDDLTFQKVLGWAFAPLAWLLGVPWDEAAQAGSYMGEKTVLNEFVAFSSFGPHVPDLSSTTVVIVTFALAGLRELRLDRDPDRNPVQSATGASDQRRAARPASAAGRQPGQPGQRRHRRSGRATLTAR